MTDSLKEYLKTTQYIVATPGTMGGMPRIAGHRFTISFLIANLQDMSLAEIAEDYDFELEELKNVINEVAVFFDQKIEAKP